MIQDSNTLNQDKWVTKRGDKKKISNLKKREQSEAHA